MKLTGITLATGTNALAAAINYDRSKLPHVRLSSRIDDIDTDNILILGANNRERNFHLLAQIHGDNVRPIDNSLQNSRFTARQAHLTEQQWKDLTSFSAYIESMPYVD